MIKGTFGSLDHKMATLLIYFVLFCFALGERSILIFRSRNKFRTQKNYERTRSTPPKLEKGAPNIGGKAANIARGFFKFWRGGTRSLIVTDFAQESLITTRDNISAYVCNTGNATISRRSFLDVGLIN